MKNLLKVSVAALAIALSAAGCSGCGEQGKNSPVSKIDTNKKSVDSPVTKIDTVKEAGIDSTKKDSVKKNN
ncbi:hypothetical protein [Mucilaginibacter ginsenosidivorans]|uniref:Cytochrome C551 n=1 Tax=Mucilaginibacter ginsenosidivorans TaxID=398053 RepID=A0A5B8UXX6_9SPHI|nr:hypothetical protein [Mucilaginibacter ginsenosidivorans]QEC63914.1 hypothetical protein FRZ54_15465 [Mucilaginibacter ginsenosidivorans]